VPPINGRAETHVYTRNVDSVADRFRFRLFPALLLAIGIGVLGSGLLSYTNAAEPAPTAVAIEPFQPLPTIDPSLVLPNGGAATAAPTFPPDRVVTRVVVPSLGIDLPVIAQPPTAGDFPLCGVAEYYQLLGQPGSGRATYLYAHAVAGMFRPLLVQSRINNGAGMLGMTVEVYTSDNMLFLYKVTEVRRHQTSIMPAFADHVGLLWLQTCEGPTLDTPKVFVIGEVASVGPASPTAAHPVPHAWQCM
jgi:hypothetical protein